MKNIIFLLSILFLISCANNEKEKNDLSKENLKGNVKSVKKNSFVAVDKFGEISKGGRLKEQDFMNHQIFDNKGNKIERNGYDSDGSLSNKWTYKHDDKGNQIEGNCYDSNGSLSLKYTYKHDDKGNQIERIGYDSDGSFFNKWTYKDDDNGNLIESNIIYDSDGSLSFKYNYEYTYDEKNNWIKCIEFINDIPLEIVEREIEYF